MEHGFSPLQLTATGLLTAWERGSDVPALLRPAEITAVAWPGSALPAERLPVGTCETVALAVHVGTFGANAAAIASCPECDETVEVDVDAGSILAGLPAPAADAAGHVEGEADGIPLRLRLPSCGDLLALSDHSGAAEEARAQLVAECLEQSTTNVTPELVATASELIEAADPAADIRLKLECPRCGAGWSAPWAVGTFVWEEIQAAARGLLIEVDELAARYGWREADILAMSPARRRAYLDLG